MTKEELIRDFDLLPLDIRRRIEKIITDARKEAGIAKKPAIRKPLSEHPFIGMWKDRKDMQEGGAAWVRKLRREQWDRSSRWTK